MAIVSTKKKSKEAASAKKESTKVLTPMGRFSFPYLAKPDEGRKYSSGKYSVDLLIKKEDFKTEGKSLRDMVLKVGRQFFQDDSLELSDFKNPFKDMDKVDDVADYQKGCILIKAKSDYQPVIFGPDKAQLSSDEIAAIKGGDYGRLIVTVFGYEQQGGGVTLALSAVQFARAGEALGTGVKQYLSMIDEIEVTADEPELEKEEAKEEDSDMKF